MWLIQADLVSMRNLVCYRRFIVALKRKRRLGMRTFSPQSFHVITTDGHTLRKKSLFVCCFQTSRSDGRLLLPVFLRSNMSDHSIEQRSKEENLLILLVLKLDDEEYIKPRRKDHAIFWVALLSQQRNLFFLYRTGLTFLVMGTFHVEGEEFSTVKARWHTLTPTRFNNPVWPTHHACAQPFHLVN